MVKTTGVNFKKFYSDPDMWPEGYWHEDEIVCVNGVRIEELYEEMPDDAKVTIEGGCIVSEEGVHIDSMESLFRKWKKKQTSTYIITLVPNDKMDQFIKAVKAVKGVTIYGK